MPQTAAATETAMDAQGTRNVAGRHNVQINLTFDGVTWNPGAFYDALNSLYGTVQNQRDSMATQAGASTYDLLITP